MENKPNKGTPIRRLPLKPGIAPYLQLKEMKKQEPRMRYLPHNGAKQKRKALLRAMKTGV